MEELRAQTSSGQMSLEELFLKITGGMPESDIGAVLGS
jgi:hypothetical protein